MKDTQWTMTESLLLIRLLVKVHHPHLRLMTGKTIMESITKTDISTEVVITMEKTTKAIITMEMTETENTGKIFTIIFRR